MLEPRLFQSRRAPEAVLRWLAATLNREGAKLGTRVARLDKAGCWCRGARGRSGLKRSYGKADENYRDLFAKSAYRHVRAAGSAPPDTSPDSVAVS